MTASTLRLPSALRFTAPPPGLEPRVDFTLAAIDGSAGLFSLTAGDGTARLFVLDAAAHLPDYAPQAPPSDVELVGTSEPAVLVVVNPGAQITVNLAAPILVNADTGACLQVILDGDKWPLRAPLGQAS